MSYSLVPYMVDLDKVRKAVGSGDADLVEQIRNSDPQRFGDDGEDLSLGTALQQLVMGEPLIEEHGYQYGYALEQLVKHLGKELPLDLWCGVRWAAVADSGVEPILMSGSPVPLPEIPDFPTIGHLPREMIISAVAKMGDEGLGHANPELLELLKEFETWMREAAREKLDIVLFYY